MAFTDLEAYQIRKFLGYPQVSRQANPRLESAITVVGNDPNGVADVQAILSLLAQVEDFINNKDIKLAGLKSVDNQEVEWYEDHTGGGNLALKAHWKQGNYLCNQLSIIFGVPIQSRIFGTQGYTGDQWKQFGGAQGPHTTTSASQASFLGWSK